MSNSDAYSASGLVAPKGVGGWLLFLVFTMIFFAPAAQIVGFLASFRHAMEVSAQALHPNSQYLSYAAEQVAGFALFGYGIFAGIQLWRIRPTALTHAKRFLLLVLVYRLADFAEGATFAWIMEPPGSLSRYLSGALPIQLRLLIYPVVWYWYLLRSKRVFNTFLSGTQADSDFPGMP